MIFNALKGHGTQNKKMKLQKKKKKTDEWEKLIASEAKRNKEKLWSERNEEKEKKTARDKYNIHINKLNIYWQRFMFKELLKRFINHSHHYYDNVPNAVSQATIDKPRCNE